MVFGKSAGENAANYAKKNGSHPKITIEMLEKAIARFDSFRNANGSEKPSKIRKSLQEVMQNHGSIFRSAELLASGREKLQKLWEIARNDIKISDKSLMWNNELLEALETDNLLRLAMVTLASAENRKESRGAHFRDDFPNRDDANFLSHSLVSMDDAGKITCSTRPVILENAGKTLSFPPEERKF